MGSYTGPDGTLYIWTGTGYQAIPKIAAADVGDMTRAEQSGSYTQGDNDVAWRTPGFSGYGITNMDPYGDLAKMGQFNWSPQQYGTKDSFNYLLKSGDKEGSLVNYRLQDGYYTPTMAGVQGWDTNNSDRNMALLRVASGPFLAMAGAAMTGAEAAAPSMGMYGPSIDAGLAAGNVTK